jgi:hypothetical protein
MNCAEAVKCRRLLWKPFENRTLKGDMRRAVRRDLVDPCESAQIRGRSSSKNKRGPGQPPEPHRSWISRPAFPPLGAAGRWHWSDSAHEECHIYQYWLQPRDSENRATAIPAAASGPARSKSKLQRRPQCPGNQHALTRFRFSPGNSPSRIASLPLASPQSSVGKL